MGKGVSVRYSSPAAKRGSKLLRGYKNTQSSFLQCDHSD